ncbi:putative endonuclease/Exonuclease/phosphatase family protein [Lyophyllum shimeji]|uniref:Endonuclease/Exonuclease/phosphatase family protein n=1 Tax=Lyophyllum shimeji TaxID=47721 RepID=A0A9P3PGU3_LYOSH|nr:putative endonuclease/Exonuclease/phosphatase family protein [Lyophyllum shimeji]
MDLQNQIRVLSLNCWDLKYVAKNRKERIEGIAEALSHSDYDIIALQELWVFADYEKIQQRVSPRLPNSKFFYSGALGAGLAIFSRYPIISTSIHPYSLNGAPIDVAAGDWFVGKAAASVVILHPTLAQVSIFNTHLFAKGGEDGPEYNRAHRLVGAWEFAKLTRQAAEMGRYVIALGDFNSIPTTLPITVIREHAGLADAWIATHSDDTSTTSVSSPLEAVQKYGVTADSPLNSYSAGKPLDPYARRFLGKRLDYILYRQPFGPPTSPDSRFPTLRPTDCRVVMTGKVPGHDCSYSDHFGLEATFKIETPTEQERAVDRARSSVSPQPMSSELSSATMATVIQALTSCYQFSRQRSRKELRLFGICLLLLLAITIGTSWLPHVWINPIFFVLTIFLSWLATTMLYEGFLYGNWECNALTNAIEELEIHRKGLALQAGTRRNSVGY